MRLFFAILIALVGVWVDPGSIGDTPFAELTLYEVGGALLALALYGVAFACLIASILVDRIWPWRWTLRYFGDLLIRAFCLSVIGICLYYLLLGHGSLQLRYPLLTLSCIYFAWVTCFSPKLSFFENHKKISQSDSQ